MRSHLLLGTLLPLASAHFVLTYPPARGFDEDTLVQFPCGGQNTVSQTRTPWPISGGPIQLDMHHTASKVQVLMALGNDPGTNFNIELLPTVQEQGPQNFCIAGSALRFPMGLNVTEGMNATIQVVTNGDPSGGLYNCADITFTSAMLSTEDYNSHCQNSTGVTVAAISGSPTNANGTSPGSTAAAASGSASASASGSAAGGSSTGAAAPQATFAGLVMGAMGLLAGVAAL